MENRIPLIAGNWKMNKTVPESIETVKTLVKLTADVQGVDMLIAPPFTSLWAVGDVLKHTKIALGAQDMFWESHGAFTGQVSADMLRSCGCSHVIIGHSERRQFFGETNQTVNKKLKAALAAGLIPIFCIGETEIERETQKTFSVLDKQLIQGVEGLILDDHHPLVIAYEPVWAIGTGKTALPEQAQEVHAYVRSLFAKVFGNSLAKKIRILYGGSVKPDNISELMGLPDVDGALVGGASLEPESFNKIIHF